MRSAAQVRQEFLDFFEARGHRIVPSAPVFPKDDPTLLFTNAGMNQFKDVFLGTGSRDYARAADTQKCIRVSGKHNDLEEVGRDTYHHTFFEMLGNWSFGDYFKREAIAWAWELLTKVWGLPEDRLWVTVFGGDEADGLPADDEAERIWIDVAGVSPDRVLRFGRKDNFWEMGDTGPCGPCTEIHIDRGGPDTDRRDGADREIGVNAGNERFIELWNNVFIQFNRDKGGRLSGLPARHVDTGMGFERITAVLQGKSSNYDTDLFTPLFLHLAQLTGHDYAGTMSDRDIAFRVVADHVRALTAAFSDGALPGNEGRGYVLRRLLRRAARFGRQALGMTRPFIHELVPTVAGVLGGAFPEMRERVSHVEHLIESEERAFAATLDKGLILFESVAAEVEGSGRKAIPGERAYDLYATFGFPRDLVDLMARERGLQVEEAGWDLAEREHKLASKGAGSGGWLVDPQSIAGLPATASLCHGLEGEGCTRSEARLLKIIDGRIAILDRTPFYAESGGQVGDRGSIQGDGFRFRVDDTQKMGSVVLHIGTLLEEGGEACGTPVVAEVDAERRLDIMANHTATHLLHWALREVLGTHVNQQGSLVAPDRLRFDLTHPKAITLDQIERIESLINDRIAAATPLKSTVEDLDAAKARGVMALFGEKYDRQVRVVDIGGYSAELCGGTHCQSTGQIGAFAIVGESAVQAGVRRIEAVTRGAAIRRMQEQRRMLKEAGQLLKVAEGDLAARIRALQDQVKELKKGGGRDAAQQTGDAAANLLKDAIGIGGVRVIVKRLDGADGKTLSAMCDSLRGGRTAVCGVLGAEADGRVQLAAFASSDLAGRRIHAGNLVKMMAGIVGGGGGGRPDFAQAGGRDPSRLEEALAAGRAAIETALAS